MTKTNRNRMAALMLALALILSGCNNDGGVSFSVSGPDGLQSISVTTAPTKTGYIKGESFTPAGIVVTGTYDDGSTVSVTKGFTLKWNNATLLDNDAITAATGQKTVGVEWRGKAAQFSISVSDGENLPVSNTTSWLNALQIITAGENGTASQSKGYTITVAGNVGVDSFSFANTFGNKAYITVTVKGSGKLSLTTKADSNNGSIFRLGANQSLIIDSASLTLEGKTGNNRAVVYLDFATAKAELKNGTISGNSNNSGGGSVGGGGVNVNDGTFTMSGGTISGNTSGGGGGVCIYSDGAFTKTGGTIYGYDSSDATNPLWNKASNGNATYGHAVYYRVDNNYYRDTTLNAGNNISTTTLPTQTGAGNTVGNWIKN